MESRTLETFEPRAVCTRCNRPERVCYCAHLVSLPTRTRVVILQHPRERDMPIGTAHMATLCLPNSELHVGIDWSKSAALSRAIGDPERPAVLLYPGDGATDLLENPPAGPCTLVVLDGTWWQARKLLRSNPVLEALPRVAFTPSKLSEYRIRKEPQDDYVSTIEALVEVLPALEGDGRTFEGMLAPFRAMVDAQIESEATRPKVHGGPSRKRLKLRRNSLAKLRERTADLVCVVVEASAWARRRGEFPARDELVYFAAYRPSTGETLTVPVRPVHGLAPNTLSQTLLSNDVLAQGITRDELTARIAGFFRDTDVVCTWGDHTVRLCQETVGAFWNEHFDVRQIARDRAQGKVGAMPDVLASLDLSPPPPLGDGRAGLRLGQLSAIVRGLCA